MKLLLFLLLISSAAFSQDQDAPKADTTFGIVFVPMKSVSLGYYQLQGYPAFQVDSVWWDKEFFNEPPPSLKYEVWKYKRVKTVKIYTEAGKEADLLKYHLFIPFAELKDYNSQ